MRRLELACYIPCMRADTGILEGAGKIRKTRAVVDLAKPPPTRDLNSLRNAAKKCKACPLWKSGTQTVFGEGPAHARIIFVGEQPGDKEDLEGKPFIGPAGRMLDKALQEAGVDRSETYVTNAVKHFKWEPAGKRRLHKKPNSREIAACRPWLNSEIESLRPELIVCLGVTAAQSVLQRAVKIGEERGKLLESDYGAKVLVTIHPSALLRMQDQLDKEEAWAAFVRDLKVLRRR
jgi:uracil-DNA glycosylase family protein